MAGGRRIPVTVEADTKGDFDKASRGLDGVASSADDADRSLGKLTKGHQALDAEINKVAYSVKAMRGEFATSGELGLLADIDRQERALKRLQTQLGKFGDESPGKNKAGLLDFAIDEALVNGVKAAGKGVHEAWDGIWKAAANNPVVSTAIVGGLVVGAPLIIATIGGAIASGVALGLGGGVMALGISRAVKDARVSAAWSELADTATESLDRSSGRFVEPLIRSANRFEDAWTDDVMPHIDSAMVALAPKLDDLTDSAVRFVQNVGPGFDDAVEAAGPFIDLLSEHLPEIGDSISSFLGHLENAGPGAEAFFDDLLTLTEQTIRVLGWLTEKGAATYEMFSALGFLLQGDVRNAAGSATDGFFHLIGSGEKVARVGDTAAGVFGKVAAAIVPVGREASITGDQFTALSGQINATAQTSDILAGQMAGKIFNSMMSLDQAALSFARSQTQVTESIKDNGRSLDIHTAKGQANIGSILGAVQANMAQYQANIAVGMSSVDAAKAYDTNTAALEAQLRQAHFTQAEIDGLIGKYRNVPSKVNTDIAMKGLTEAIQSLDDAIRLANNLDGRRVTTTIETRETRVYSTIDANGARHASKVGVFAEGGIRKAAVGLIIPPSDPGTVLTAEPQTGGEVLTPLKGISQARAMQLTAPVADAYDFSVVPNRQSGYASPVMASRGAGGYVDHRTVNYNIYDATDPDRVVAAIKRYENNNGDGWRSSN